MAKKSTQEENTQEQDQVTQDQPTLTPLEEAVAQVVQSAVELVAARRTASSIAAQSNVGPGGVSEAMKAVAKAEGVFTAAVDQYTGVLDDLG